jgi:hypothetical protein
MQTRQALIIGLCVLVAAAGHTAVTAFVPEPKPRPLSEGYGVGSMAVREKDAVAELKFNGCKVECYDQFVVVHIDKAREPTWTGNYIKVIPWEKIEHMTLLPHPPAE